MSVILASNSAARKAMLIAAGVDFVSVGAPVDEDAAKSAFRARGLGARDLADALAELKALRVSQKHGGAFVIGCDQTLALDDGTMMDKPADRAALARQLSLLSDKTHTLFSAAVIAVGGQPVWRHVEKVELTVRRLSPAFISDYAATVNDDVLGCVGGYKIEDRGVQLFSAIAGSHFAILGLPLLPLLDYLRVRGELLS